MTVLIDFSESLLSKRIKQHNNKVLNKGLTITCGGFRDRGLQGQGASGILVSFHLFPLKKTLCENKSGATLNAAPGFFYMVPKAGLVKYIMNTVSYWFICKF